MRAKMTWLVVAVVAMIPIVTRATPNNGVLFNIITRGSTGDEIATSARTGRWHAVLHTNSPTDFVSQDVAFAPGGYSGWHSHPGFVLASVTAGTLTLYNADDPSCTPTFVSAGQAFMEKPGHVHFARNEGTMPEQHVSTYVVPLGSPLVTDAPNPGNCPF